MPNLPKLSDEQISDVIDHYVALDSAVKEIREALKLLAAMTLDEKDIDVAEYARCIKIVEEAAHQKRSYNEDIQKTKLLLLSQLNDKVNQKSNKAATVSRTKHLSYTSEDITQLKDYSTESGDWGWVSASVGKEWCVEYEQQHGEPPPGVEKFEEWRMKFSRKRKKV